MAKILLVEDKDVTTNLLARILKDEGYDVITACDGPSALAVAKTHPFDLILTDWQFEGSPMDGCELTRQFKAAPETRTVPVVMISASGKHVQMSALAAGCDGFIAKPMRMHELLQKIRQQLDRAAVQE